MTTTIQPLPSLYTLRFGRRRETFLSPTSSPSKPNEVIRPAPIDANQCIALTGIRNRDWTFADDLQTLNTTVSSSAVKFHLLPSVMNTLKMHRSNTMIHDDELIHQYEDYDLDEDDVQWLTAYNQYRLEKGLPEVDENIFEFVLQALEQQCFAVYRRKNHEDDIQCDACYRLDDVDDLIQCAECNTIVHKKCYGIDEDLETWRCLRCCQLNNSSIICYLCNQKDGALKPLKICNHEDQSAWIHLSCAFWCPSILFQIDQTLMLFDQLSNDGTCSICAERSGVKIVCSAKHCSVQFHARCAMNHSLDMFVVESDERSPVQLMALCHHHTERIDSAENELRKKRTIEQQQHRFEEFSSDIDLDLIKKQTGLSPDVVDCIHSYWLLKREANGARPLIDLPDDAFRSGFDRRVNLKDFARRYRLALMSSSPSHPIGEKPMNMLQCLATKSEIIVEKTLNLLEKFARRPRVAFKDYDRHFVCFLDHDKKRRSDLLSMSLVLKEDL